MKKKIFLFYMLLIIIGFTAAGLFTSQLAVRLYQNEVTERLKVTASLIKYQMSQNAASGKPVDYNRAALDYTRVLDVSTAEDSTGFKTRITFIDYQGNVLGESEKDYHEMENHLNRKEIQEAIKGGTGVDIRVSRSLGISFLYLAIPLENGNTVLRVSVPLVEIQYINRTIIFYTVYGMLAGLLLTALLALWFSSGLVSPVRELISVSRRIADGDYGKRARLKTGDELGELSNTFNDMAEKLEKTVAELKDKNLKLDSVLNSLVDGIIAVDAGSRIMLVNEVACRLFDIESEKKVIGQNLLEVIRNHHINAQLQETISSNRPQVSEAVTGTHGNVTLRVYTSPMRSKDASFGAIASIHDITGLRKLEQIRTDFVSNVTHELKTPLTSIRGFIETLRNGAINDSSVSDKFLEIIDIEAERLFMLINDILQLSEIESRQHDTGIGSYSLKEITAEVVSFLEGIAQGRHVRLSFDIDDKVIVKANRDRIKQMLINLVDNGIKYNMENGSVHITAGRDAGGVIISVRDTGIGIPAEHLPRIFERFYRVDKGRSRSMGGTGLGLSIVKHIVNLYNGNIKVNSEPGKGTEFIIKLPE